MDNGMVNQIENLLFPRQYSGDLLAKIEGAKKLTRWLLDNQPLSTKATDRNRITGAFFNIALDNHGAMVFLLSNQMVSPAFSLARSVWEAYVRGLWASNLADDRKLNEFMEGRYDPKMDSIIKAINKHAELGAENKIGLLHDQSWKTLNSYAHGGSLQIQRWITSTSVEASHSDEEIGDLLRFANHVAFRSGAALADLAEQSNCYDLYIEKIAELVKNDWY